MDSVVKTKIKILTEKYLYDYSILNFIAYFATEASQVNLATFSPPFSLNDNFFHPLKIGYRACLEDRGNDGKRPRSPPVQRDYTDGPCAKKVRGILFNHPEVSKKR